MTLLSAQSIKKRFGGVTALSGADFDLRSGEVHVLLGSNGCGKSTLCKVISGVVRPDSGTVRVKDRLLEDITPRLSRERGVGVVYQELSLVPSLSVAQNILLGMEKVNGLGILRDTKNEEALEEIFSEFRDLFPRGFSLETMVHALTPDLQQLVEIMKVLARDPEILIFDEPTASLSKEQIDLFFGILDRLKAKEKGIIFISHKLEEIFRVGDRITIMRGGKHVGCSTISSITRDEIVHLMVGDIFQSEYRKSSPYRSGRELLGGRGLSGRSIREIDFSLGQGEILGLGGLQGQGQRAFLLTLFGVEPLHEGTLEREGRAVSLKSPKQAMRESLAYISGDRKKYGVFLIRSILENLFISRVILNTMPLFRRKTLKGSADSVIQDLGLVYDTLDRPVSTLSGGNQQKVIIGRWLLNNPAVILMDDPTKGVDVKTKKDLYELMERMCQAGCSVIWNSSDDQELLQNADRVLVFREGRVIRELSGKDLNESTLYRAALGVDDPAEEGR
ncbi:monosaccharide ABC transporter ATP-binding protein, CUT2 family [Alkalispirochaeta americana]|uniref:Monosaccharide ABC transporter ATP-binding protein, CUT2 family n=1 Tax=Alkalispirochaeta americana TaxID=159291 RepID=A0A1N6NJW2_9SPIO|nr:sugar ABC transporter ATP-binding protein [Alkalispirochaeta americana]SIP92370.1 monosaccharide ABC transporter ATP-binding protein, CUT2 family [Alkalispirochaeta americana]